MPKSTTQINLFSPHITIAERTIAGKKVDLYSLIMVVRKDDQVRYVEKSIDGKNVVWNFLVFDEHEDIPSEIENHSEIRELIRPTRTLVNIERESFDIIHAYLEEINPEKTALIAKTSHHPGHYDLKEKIHPKGSLHDDGTVHLPHDPTKDK